MAGLDANLPIDKLSVLFAQWVMDDIHGPYHIPSKTVEAFAPTKRKDLWRKLGLFPGDGYSEVVKRFGSCKKKYENTQKL